MILDAGRVCKSGESINPAIALILSQWVPQGNGRLKGIEQGHEGRSFREMSKVVVAVFAVVVVLVVVVELVAVVG